MLHLKTLDSKESVALHLSPQDVQKLLAPETTVAARREVSQKVAANYSREGFNPREAMIAEQIFRLLVRDTEVSVRASLSEQLKSSRTLPRDVALSMARDVKEVALPMLHYSEVLSDEDLIELTRAMPESWRGVAVAERRVVSEALADSLLAHGRQEVAEALVKNSGAVLSDSSLGHILERYGAQTPIVQALAERPAVPPSIMEKAVSHMSGALAGMMQKKYQAHSIESEQVAAREMSTVALLKGRETQEDVEKLVEQLYAFNRLTAPLIFTALGEGKILFFEASLARLGGVAYESARTLINDRGDLGFRALYNKSSLPPELFSAARKLLSVVHALLDHHPRMEAKEFSKLVMDRLLSVTLDEGVPNLPELIAMLRKGQG